MARDREVDRQKDSKKRHQHRRISISLQMIDLFYIISGHHDDGEQSEWKAGTRIEKQYEFVFDPRSRIGKLSLPRSTFFSRPLRFHHNVPMSQLGEIYSRCG